MLAKIELQSQAMATESPDSVRRETVRRRVSDHLSAVRRRRPRLSALTSSTRHHAPSGRLRRALHSLSATHFAPPSPRCAPPHFGELLRPFHRVSGQANPPRAPPRRPLPRSHLLGHCRARVRRNCRAPRSSSSPEFRPSSPATWPGLSAPPFSFILVPITSPWLTDARREALPRRHFLDPPA